MIRTAAFFSPHDPHNFAVAVRRTLSEGRRFQADDLTVSPAYVPDLVAATLDLVLDGETGVRHLANAGAITWADFARSLADALDLDAGLVSEVPHLQLNWAAPRPWNSALASNRGQCLPPLGDAIQRFSAADAGRAAPRLPQTPARPRSVAPVGSPGARRAGRAAAPRPPPANLAILTSTGNPRAADAS